LEKKRRNLFALGKRGKSPHKLDDPHNRLRGSGCTGKRKEKGEYLNDYYSPSERSGEVE